MKTRHAPLIIGVALLLATPVGAATNPPATKDPFAFLGKPTSSPVRVFAGFTWQCEYWVIAKHGEFVSRCYIIGAAPTGSTPKAKPKPRLGLPPLPAGKRKTPGGAA